MYQNPVFANEALGILIDQIDGPPLYITESSPLYARVLSGKFGEVKPYLAPPPSRDDVNNERERRIEAGFRFNGLLFDFDSRAKANISGAAQLAFMAVVAGAQPGDLRWADHTSEFGWIASNNNLIMMDAHTTIAFGRAAAAHEKDHIFAARALKDADPIPADFADDKWWP